MMKIGIITYYKVENFGANLQALSTYNYLSKNGFDPVLICYQSKEMQAYLSRSTDNKQLGAHLSFVDQYMPNQTKACSNIEELNQQIEENAIENIIIGSDAVLQHHPLLSRIHRGRRKPIYIEKVIPERMFPNPFWGVGLPDDVRCALMSVSSQNSRYNLFSHSLRMKMERALSRFSYISVRDSWTQKMLYSINGNSYQVTPDPVFAFNQNAEELIPTKDDCLKKFHLPENYVLVSLMRQHISTEQLSELKSLFLERGLNCVSLPMPTGCGFKNDFDYHVPEPLDPLDWYALIKYASGYVGSNMHPIIVSLHNGVPCYSIDNWGTLDFFNRRTDNGSSKIEDIMRVFGVNGNHRFISKNKCDISPTDVVSSIISFPKDRVIEKSREMTRNYQEMMGQITKCFK